MMWPSIASFPDVACLFCTPPSSPLQCFCQSFRIVLACEKCRLTALQRVELAEVVSALLVVPAVRVSSCLGPTNELVEFTDLIWV